ncbi:ATP-dependent Clp protease adaptor ClpS, partial [Acidithiobacillus ferridurans]
MYRVLLVNDDFTPMDYVVHILEAYFHKPHDEAVAVM